MQATARMTFSYQHKPGGYAGSQCATVMVSNECSVILRGTDAVPQITKICRLLSKNVDSDFMKQGSLDLRIPSLACALCALLSVLEMVGYE